MDPNATLRELAALIAEDYVAHADRIKELCDALSGWLHADGFEPNWNVYPRAHGFYLAYAMGIA
jgi:hypothetical protein